MPEEENAGNGGQEEQAKAAEAAEFKAITSQAELDKLLGDRLARERAKYADYDDLKAKATAADEANKTEAEKAAERIKAAEARAAAAESTALNYRIAQEYQLSQADAMALEHIPSEDGKKAVAERLRASVEAQRVTPPKAKSLTSGSGGEPKTGEQGRAAAALRSLRQG